MNYRAFIRIKSVCTAKGRSTESNDDLQNQRRHVPVSDKASKVYKELIKLNTQKANSPVKKWVEDMDRHISNEDIQVAIDT